MSKLVGKLKNYVTVGMALDILGHPREQTGRFYTLIKQGMPTYKLGGMTLAKAHDLIFFAGLPSDTKVPWPAELAELDMSKLRSRNEMANFLGVSPRTVNRLAKKGEITAVDLSRWSGYTVYLLTPDMRPERHTVKAGDWIVETSIDDKGRLIVDIQSKERGLFIEHSLSQHPTAAFIYKDVAKPPVGIVGIHER